MKVIVKYDKIIFNIIGYIYVIILTTICLIPFIMLLSGSLTSDSYILRHGYGILPGEFSTSAYRLFFKSIGKLLDAYKVSVFVTLVGTGVGVFITAMTAYVLYRKDFAWRNKFAFLLYFTMLFSGGLIPSYIINTRYLHFRDSYVALIAPGLLSVFNILIMRNFMTGSIPDSLFESAKIDGADDFSIFIKVVMPLITPASACIGLFMGVNYWNDWVGAMLYISKENMYPLQYMLTRILQAANYLSSMASEAGIDVVDYPKESTKLAMTVLAVGPIILAYPFVQKYFVKGITIGAVKG